MEVAVVLGVEQGDRLAGCAGAGGAADAVDVVFGRHGEVVIDNQRNAFDIEAARGDVGSNQDVVASLLEHFDGAQAVSLVNVAVDAGGVIVVALEALAEFFGFALGGDKDDDGAFFFVEFLTQALVFFF